MMIQAKFSKPVFAQVEPLLFKKFGAFVAQGQLDNDTWLLLAYVYKSDVPLAEKLLSEQKDFISF